MTCNSRYALLVGAIYVCSCPCNFAFLISFFFPLFMLCLLLWMVLGMLILISKASVSVLCLPLFAYRHSSVHGLEAEASHCSAASNCNTFKSGAAAAAARHDQQPGSTRASWGAYPAAVPATHRPPASPPILRSDRFVDKEHGQQSGGNSSGKEGGGRASKLPGAGGSNRESWRKRIY